MKLEFLDDMTGGGKYPYADPAELIRLYSFDSKGAKRLFEAIESWIRSGEAMLDFTLLDFVESVNCTLKFEISVREIGIEPSLTNDFICRLTMDSFQNMLDIIAAFCDKDVEGTVYNWLYDPTEGHIDLLFSPGGSW